MAPSVSQPSQNPTSGEARLWSKTATACTIGPRGDIGGRNPGGLPAAP